MFDGFLESNPNGSMPNIPYQREVRVPLRQSSLILDETVSNDIYDGEAHHH